MKRFGLVGWTLVLALTALLVLTTCGRPARLAPAPPAPSASAAAVAAVSTLEDQLGRRLDIVNTYRRFDQELLTESDLTFTNRGSTMMISWAGGDTRAITAGQYDSVIRTGARAVKAFARPTLLRFRWEMHRPNMAASMWSPADYIAARKHVRSIFTAEGATNVSWVWCPTNEGFVGGYAQPFYPGDDHVAGAKFAPLGDLLLPFLRWSAQRPTKPIMIGEFGVARAWGTAQRAAWLRDAALVFKANPQISAALYFESDPENGNGTTNNEFRMSDDRPVLAAFTELAREPYFNPPRR